MFMAKKTFDFTKISPDTLERFNCAQELKKNNPTVPLSQCCKRAGISQTYFYEVVRAKKAVKTRTLERVDAHENF